MRIAFTGGSGQLGTRRLAVFFRLLDLGSRLQKPLERRRLRISRGIQRFHRKRLGRKFWSTKM